MNDTHAVDFAAIPESLKALPRWLCWRYEERDGKATKVPYIAGKGWRASSIDPETWTDFNTAFGASENYDGIGIVLGEGLAGVDLDNSVEENGQLKTWAAGIVEDLDSYTEISPSGRGVKIFLRASLDRDRHRRDLGDGHIEIYWEERYFTVTGRHLPGTPATVRERPEKFRELHLELFPPPEPEPTPRAPAPGLADGELLERMFAASNGAEIKRLWEGDTSAYPSHSEADAALCAHLAFWTGGDTERIDHLFRQSGLCRDKWTERSDYRQATIGFALKERGETYRPAQAGESGVDISAIAGPKEKTETYDHTDPGPIPERLLYVPGFVDEVMRYTLETAPYPNRPLAFGGALGLQGHLAGRKVRDSANNRTNLYILILANSGTGKDHPRKVNQMVCQEVGLADSLGDAFASGEGIEDRLFTCPAMLFQTDEIDKVIIAMKEGREQRFEGIMQMLLKMYTSSDGLYPMRVKAGKEHQFIDQPSLSIMGSAVPGHYYEAMSPKMLTNGFFARMLVIEAGSRGQGQEPVVRELPESITDRARWWAELRSGTGNMENWHPVPTVVDYTTEARRLITEFRATTDRQYGMAEENEDGVAMTIWARAGQKARRLSLIYACSRDPGDLRITVDAVRWATQFVEHQTRRMMFMASTHVADNPFHAECLKALEKLRRAPGNELDHSTLLKRMKMRAKDFRELIETMNERGDIGIRRVPTAGRTGTYYYLAGDEKTGE